MGYWNDWESWGECEKTDRGFSIRSRMRKCICNQCQIYCGKRRSKVEICRKFLKTFFDCTHIFLIVGVEEHTIVQNGKTDTVTESITTTRKPVSTTKTQATITQTTKSTRATETTTSPTATMTTKTATTKTTTLTTTTKAAATTLTTTITTTTAATTTTTSAITTTTKTSIDTTFMSYSTELLSEISANGGTHDGGWVSMSIAIDNCEKIGQQIFRIKDRTYFDMVMEYKLQNQ